MADTNINYFDVYDQETQHLFVHNAFTDRDANELYLVEGGDPKIYRGELFKRVDASSDYTRDGLPFLPVEHVPMPDQYVRRIEPYLQFEVNHRQVLNTEPYQVLTTTTEMNQDMNTYLDGVKINNQNILPNQKRAMVLRKFNNLIENAKSYGGAQGERYLQDAYHYLMTEAPEIYDVLISGKSRIRSKMKNISRYVHDEITRLQHQVTIAPGVHEQIARIERGEREKELAAIPEQRRKSVRDIVAELEGGIDELGGHIEEMSRGIASIYGQEEEKDYPPPSSERLKIDRAADILGSRLGRSLHDHMDRMHHHVLKQMAARKGLRVRNIRKDALIKSIILHHGYKNDLSNLGRELADKPVLGRVVPSVPDPCP